MNLKTLISVNECHETNWQPHHALRYPRQTLDITRHREPLDYPLLKSNPCFVWLLFLLYASCPSLWTWKGPRSPWVH